MEVSNNAGTLNNILQFFISTVIVFATVLASILLIFILIRLIKKIIFNTTLESKLKQNTNAILFIKNPPTEQGEKAMENFLHALHRVLPTNTYFSLEIASTDQFLRFYIVIPKSLKNVLESQLYAHYPNAEVEEVPDYLPKFDDNTAAAEIKFKESSTRPINTYKSLEDNLLKNLSALLSKTDKQEKAFIQFTLEKVSSKWWQQGFDNVYFHLFGQKYDKEGNPTPSHIKLSQDFYQGKLIVTFVSENKAAAETKLNTLINLYKELKSPYNELKKGQSFSTNILNNLLKARLFENSHIWSLPEIATVYHYPYKDSLVSNIVSTSSKRAPAPDLLPAEEFVDPNEVSIFGETNYRNEKKKFGIKRTDRRRHLYVIGKTGSGKSKLLELLITADIKAGHGCCLLDPHGDLADELLMYIPKERINDVIYINPAESSFPIGFNPLEPVTDNESRQQLSTFFIAIFKKLFAFNWNPRMEHLIRYITLALLETPDPNVLGIPRILSDIAFRQRVIKQIQDPVVKSFWTNEFSAWNERFANDAVIPILNKVGQFIANPIVRNMVGQRTNVLNFEKFMNEGKIVIINISKGKIGDENAALLGSMFITKIQQAALSRAKMPEDQRRDFYFYVDEFQNFATDAFSSILSEARKYHLNLTIAHQYMAQLPDDVKATTFGNVGSIVAFAVGGDDANYLAKEFSPTFTAEDMINLNLREMYVKMSINGKLTPPFSARTIDVPKPNFDYSVEIVNHSRMTYGKNRTSVENEIARWSSSAELTNDNSNKENFPEPII